MVRQAAVARTVGAVALYENSQDHTDFGCNLRQRSEVLVVNFGSGTYAFQLTLQEHPG